MKKILVLGGSGLVGSVFSRFSEKCYDLHLTYNTNSINDLKINSTKIKHKQLYLNIDKQDILEVILFLKTNNLTKFRNLDSCIGFIRYFSKLFIYFE